MAVRTLPGLGLTGFWALGSSGWKDANDVNLRLLSALVQPRAKSRTTVLPGSPTIGDIYIVRSDDGTNPNKIAIWDGEAASEAWVYVTPTEGFFVYVIDEDQFVLFDGSVWGAFSSGGGSVAVDEEGTEVVATASRLNFTGNPVSITDSGSGEVEINIGSGEITPDARYWRVSHLGPQTAPSAARIAFRETVGGSNLTGTVTASTEDVTNNAAAANDGDTATYWQALSSSLHWFAIDLGSGNSATVREIQIRARSGANSVDCFKTFQLEYSDDGLNWFHVGTRVDTGGDYGTSEVRAFDFTSAYPLPGTLITPPFILESGSANYDLTNNDLAGGVYRQIGAGGALTVTVTADLTGNRPVTFERTGAGTVTFGPDTGVTINSRGGLLAIGNQYSTVTLIPKGSNVYVLVGDLA